MIRSVFQVLSLHMRPSNSMSSLAQFRDLEAVAQVGNRNEKIKQKIYSRSRLRASLFAFITQVLKIHFLEINKSVPKTARVFRFMPDMAHQKKSDLTSHTLNLVFCCRLH